MRKQDLANLAQTCRRFAALMRDDDVLWKEACRHRFDDSWLGRREWATSQLADRKKPWRSRYRQTITTLRRWRTGRDPVHSIHSCICAFATLEGGGDSTDVYTCICIYIFVGQTVGLVVRDGADGA